MAWGMQQESFLASSIGTLDPYHLLSYLGGGGVGVGGRDYHIQPHDTHA
jgi:hypothetical protein